MVEDHSLKVEPLLTLDSDLRAIVASLVWDTFKSQKTPSKYRHGKFLIWYTATVDKRDANNKLLCFKCSSCGRIQGAHTAPNLLQIQEQSPI
jgi:hypothetical protein